MPIDCAQYCGKCGTFHLPTFDCGVEETVETVVETPVVEEPVVPEVPETPETPAETPEDTDADKEADEAVQAVVEAVADGDVSKAEVGEVLGELDDVKPTSRKKKNQE